ncbi:hypothetical protein ACJJIF_19540 [Microbulbifer sp. SSSA002]|uniref:hypothetical protein n=1 Tax=unclassified Microbulbifer TaxID=2619833 RepID=UPI00403922DC
MVNLFEVALNNKETNCFFRGRGVYFVPSPDYEGHLHGANISGHVNTFLKASPENGKKFDDAFIDFIKGLSPTESDLFHFLANFSSYVAQKNANKLPGSNLFLELDSLESTLVKDYLLGVKKAGDLSQYKDKLNTHADFAYRKGNKILKKILEGAEKG